MGLSPDERMNICVSLGRSLPTGSGALADALDDMLDRVQERFGPRDRAYVVVGIEFGGDHPKVSFPHRTARYARIRLSEGTLREARRGDLHYAFWQLAHETVHLLSPTPGRQVNVLEEGLACCFQHDYMQGYPEYIVPRQWMPSFVRAEALVTSLLALDKEAVEKARRAEPTIGRISVDTLCGCCPALPQEAAEALTARFYRDGPPPDEGPWPFQDPKTTVVVTGMGVADGGMPILTVSRASRDGVWQFLDGSNARDRLVSLSEVVQWDPSVLSLADLPLGGCAWRRTPDSPWRRDVFPE